MMHEQRTFGGDISIEVDLNDMRARAFEADIGKESDIVRVPVGLNTEFRGHGNNDFLPGARIPSATRSGDSVSSAARCEPPNTLAITVSSAGSNASIKACSKIRRRHVWDRGSKTAQIRAPGLRSRTARSVCCTAVGW